MDIKELQHIYAAHPNTRALTAKLADDGVKNLYLAGMHASSAPLFSPLAWKGPGTPPFSS
jgi:transcription-repair coupling factor (superfamily II helicase)